MLYFIKLALTWKISANFHVHKYETFAVRRTTLLMQPPPTTTPLNTT